MPRSVWTSLRAMVVRGLLNFFSEPGESVAQAPDATQKDRISRRLRMM